MIEHNTEKTVCPFCSSEWVTAEQHDRKVDRLEQEPVAFSCLRCVTPKKCAIHGCSPNTWPSEDPPQRKPLSDEEIEKLIFKSGGHKSTQNLMSNPMQVREHIELWNERIYAFARAIEAAHNIKE